MDGTSRLRPPIDALTALRFFAALLVAISHFPQVIPISEVREALERQGAAGVTIFFVLSGFVLTYNYFDVFQSSTAGARSFLRARLARIWPINVVALVVITPIIIAVTTTPSALSWVVNLFMLQALVPTRAFNTWNIPAWSVSCELVFYCVFPFFISWVLGRVRRAAHLLRLVAALFAVQVALFAAVAVVADRQLSQEGKSATDIALMLERLKFFPGLQIWAFFIGCVLGAALLRARAGDRGAWWRVFDRQATRDAMVTAAAVALLVVLLIPSVVDLPEGGLVGHLMTSGLYVVYTPLAVLLVVALAWGPTRFGSIFEHRWAIGLGEASYSFYMFQWSAVLIVAELTDGSPGWWISMAAIAALTLISVASARWIEQPTRRLLRGRSVAHSASRMRAPGPSAASTSSGL